MNLSGLSAIAPGYLQGQASQATTAINQNAAQSPAALAMILQALGVSPGPAQLGRPLAPQPVQPQGGGIIDVGWPRVGGPQFPPGGNPNPNAMFEGNDRPATFEQPPGVGRWDQMFNNNPGGKPEPGYGRSQVLQPPVSPSPGGAAAPGGSGQPSGQGGGEPPPRQAAAPPDVNPQVKQALYQMPLTDIVAAVKKANPQIDNRTLGLGLQALAPFLNQEAQRALADQRQQFTQELGTMRADQAADRLTLAQQKADPSYIADASGARTAGRISAMEEPAAKEAITLLDNAIAQSRKLPREQWKFANQVLQAGEGQMNDPKLAGLSAALYGVVNTYVRAIAGVTGRAGTVFDKKHAEQILSTAQSQEAFESAANMLKYEVEVARDAAARNRASTTGQKYDQAAPVAPNSGGVNTEIDDLVKKYGG